MRLIITTIISLGILMILFSVIQNIHNLFLFGMLIGGFFIIRGLSKIFY
tara:strand:- start:249 stop:395 length:147 start_codon:yes stop_codon:yes gene_type:complete